MTIYTCEASFEAMMSCIYTAWADKKGHRNIRLELEPVEQPELFCQYIHVDPDYEKAQKVIRSVQRKISYEAYRRIYMAAMNFDPDRLDVIYRFMLLGFAYGSKITSMMADQYVMRLFELSRKTGNEMHYFREFTRFSSVDNRVYISHIEPKCDVLPMVAEHFADRMPSEYWIMIDSRRGTAAVHPKDQPFYLTALSEKEREELRFSEKMTDRYTDLWKEFFRTIGIEARKNPKCQRNMMPIWYRKHMTEFINE